VKINLFKHTHFLIVLLLFMMFSMLVTAQNQGNGNSVSITASANVIGADIDFQTIANMEIIDAQRTQEGSVLYINPVFDPQAGIMLARGNPGAQIRVSYLSEMVIERREGEGTITFNYEISGFEGDSQRESELLDQIERELRFNDNGEFYFYIGGTVDLSNALPGNYDGEFTMEIEYM
jgi:homoserine acetyltransferase